LCRVVYSRLGIGGEEMEEKVVKKKSPKSLTILVVTALVVLGGSASAFFLLTKSPKVQYLLAESETYKQMDSLVEARYNNEMDWMKVNQEKPVETTYDLSAEWNDPSVDYEMQEIQSIINSIVLSAKQVKDPVKKEMEVGVSGKLGSVSTDFVTMFATTEKLLLSLPFKNELIRIDDSDYGKFMKEVDKDYEGNETIGLPYLFEDNYVISEELSTYLEKEYVEYIVKEIPEEAFTSDKEEITIFDEKMKTTKVVMDLSEVQVKSLLKTLFEKAKDDDKLRDALKEQIAFTSYGEDISNTDVKEIMENFEVALEDIIEGVDTLKIPNGLQSTIWHDSNIIVKREFAVSFGENEDEVATLTVDGTQLLEKTNQKWDYSIGVKGFAEDEGVIKFEGDLSWKDQKADDSISISAEELKIVYKGKEELKDNKRTFTRSFGLTDGDIDPAVIWRGTATHEKDSVKANHEFTISEKSIGETPFNLILKHQGKIVKKVDMPEETDDTVKIGEMDIDELQRFMEYDLGRKFEGWFYGLMGDVEGELSNF
jgi:hypothetical protein